ncbi:hypothetical protein PVK06_047868 [Gossypium arboreum]|uniref:Uncharacterized protein n=1 Tax=Gossypium arboreum TaxID=29729 RepID=A0ABR0MEH4_GOSAR|nr:hypothetical protein PVK06_047868 [Gossypium arboreum]
MSRYTRSYFATPRAVCSTLGCLQGYVVTSSGCATTLKAFLGFFSSAPYVMTSNGPCCNLVTDIELSCLLIVPCTFTKCIDSS